MYRLGTGARNRSLKETVGQLGYKILDSTMYMCNNVPTVNKRKVKYYVSMVMFRQTHF